MTTQFSKAIPLVTPIKRGETEINEVTLRKPKSGELRGLNLINLQMGDVNALMTIIPRISTPSLTDQEASTLETEDLSELGDVVAGFFMNAATRAYLKTSTS